MNEASTTSRSRPLSLTIIGWWLVVSGALQALTFLSYGNVMMREMWAVEGVDMDLAITWSMLSGAAYLFAGTGVLRGHRWGRAVYLVTGLLGVVAGAVILKGTLAASMLGVLIFGVFAWFLSRPEAEAYFEGTWEPVDRPVDAALRTIQTRERNPSDIQRVFGVIGAVGSGFLIEMALLFSGMFFSEGAMVVFLAGFFLVPGAIGLFISVFLWGRKRWAGLVGWTLGAVGFMTAFSGVSMMTVVDSEYWQAVSAEVEGDFTITRQGSLILSLAGILVLLAGTALVLRQRSRDAAAASGAVESRDG